VAPGLPPSGIEEGLASWYGVDEAGRATASGELMDPERLTAAHRSLPFGSLVRVTDLQTGKKVDVIVNDRGPHVSGRIIDLSFAAARELDLVNRGVTPVRLQVIGLEGPLAERRWRVQVGSFTEQGRAGETATLLQAEGFSPVVVSSFQEGEQIFYRVWVGEYRERDGAESLARQLARDGHPGFVLLGAVSSP
jgi:peptidoglycan lytic transglycosylase